MEDDNTPVPMPKDAAWEFTEGIRTDLTTAYDAIQSAKVKIPIARERMVWKSMGYESMEEYIENEFGEELGLLRIKVDDRMELVNVLSDSGLSNRQIAGTLGVNEKTVRNDLKTSRQLGAENSAPMGDETAGQSGPQWNDHGVGDQLDIEPGPSHVENRKKDEDEEEDENIRKRREEWFNSINLDRMVIQTPTIEMVEPEVEVRPFYTIPAEEKPVFIGGQQLTPNAKIPERTTERPLLPPPDRGQYVISTRMIPDPVSEIPPPPPEVNSHKHCKTCACNLLP